MKISRMHMSCPKLYLEFSMCTLTLHLNWTYFSTYWFVQNMATLDPWKPVSNNEFFFLLFISVMTFILEIVSFHPVIQLVFFSGLNYINLQLQKNVSIAIKSQNYEI